MLKCFKEIRCRKYSQNLLFSAGVYCRNEACSTYCVQRATAAKFGL